jgi:hypothetical protein
MNLINKKMESMLIVDKRRTFRAKFKTKIVLELLHGEKVLNVIRNSAFQLRIWLEILNSDQGS